jgi:hypothetical protein
VNSVPVDPTLRAEIMEGRDLNEHWTENLPVFNVTPRVEPSRRSGKDFAARNPSTGPYNWLAWDGKRGPRLLPNVTAFAVHELSGVCHRTAPAARRARPTGASLYVRRRAVRACCCRGGLSRSLAAARFIRRAGTRAAASSVPLSLNLNSAGRPPEYAHGRSLWV